MNSYDDPDSKEVKVPPLSPEAIFLQLQTEAKSESPDALYLLGQRYFHGSGTPKDLHEGLKLWRLAAEKGYVDAECDLGSAYARGDGVERDMEEAVRWLNLAIEHHHTLAAAILGEYYLNGNGVVPDAKKALNLAKEGEAKNEPLALSLLGAVYAKGGQGVRANLVLAAQYYRRAVELGVDEAKQHLLTLQESVRPKSFLATIQEKGLGSMFKPSSYSPVTFHAVTFHAGAALASRTLPRTRITDDFNRLALDPKSFAEFDRLLIAEAEAHPEKIADILARLEPNTQLTIRDRLSVPLAVLFAQIFSPWPGELQTLLTQYADPIPLRESLAKELFTLYTKLLKSQMRLYDAKFTSQEKVEAHAILVKITELEKRVMDPVWNKDYKDLMIELLDFVSAAIAKTETPQLAKACNEVTHSMLPDDIRQFVREIINAEAARGSHKSPGPSF